MKLIKYVRLYDRLRAAELKPWEAVVAINELRKADPEILEEVFAWCDGASASDLTIHGVSYTSLVNEETGEGMKPHRAFLMLDWLKKDPEEALHYLATYRFRQPLQPPTKDELDMLNRRIAELKAKNPEIETPEVDLPEPTTDKENKEEEKAEEKKVDAIYGVGEDIPVEPENVDDQK